MKLSVTQDSDAVEPHLEDSLTVDVAVVSSGPAFDDIEANEKLWVERVYLSKRTATLSLNGLLFEPARGFMGLLHPDLTAVRNPIHAR